MDVWLSASGIAVVIVMILLTFILWKVAKILLVPIQILLFLALMFIAWKLIFAPEKGGVISDPSAKKQIQGLVDKASDSAARFVKQQAAAGKDAVKKKVAEELRNAVDSAAKDTPAPAAEPRKEAAAAPVGPQGTEAVGGAK